MKAHWFTRTLFLIPLVLNACAPAMVKDAMPEKSPETMGNPTEVMMETPADAMAKPTEVMMETSPDTMEKPTEVMMETPADIMEKSTEVMMETPKWFSASLTDVASGKAFKVADFKGKVVLVEALAQWCSNCKSQQQQVLDLQKTLGQNPDFVSIGLDIDPKEDASQLKKYIETNGFSWTYAIAPSEVSRELAALYGTQFLNPPSTPMLVIDRKGEVTVLPLGSIKSSSELLQAIEPLLKAGM